MIRVFPFNELGNHDYGWLDAHYHFSFANYCNPVHNGFPPLIVWNDDRIKPGTGFPMHSHMNMEIITYIRQGAITHEDSLGNKGVTKAGEIQIMSAGTGITHAESNQEDEETLLFQIWIQPERNQIKPRWENVNIDSDKLPGIKALASGQKQYVKSNLVIIHQDTTLFSIKGDSDHPEKYTLLSNRQIYLVVSKGKVKINEVQASSRDGVFIKDENKLEFIFEGDSELILLDLPELST